MIVEINFKCTLEVDAINADDPFFMSQIRYSFIQQVRDADLIELVKKIRIEQKERSDL